MIWGLVRHDVRKPWPPVPDQGWEKADWDTKRTVETLHNDLRSNYNRRLRASGRVARCHFTNDSEQILRNMELMMKTLFSAATLVAVLAFAGCQTTHSHDHAAPGATSGECCGSCADEATTTCCGSCGGDAAPGAVSSDAGCAASCGDTMPPAPGAVSSDAGCAASCGDKMPAAPGAVSSEAGCASSCSDKMSTTSGGCPMSSDKG